MDEKQNSAKQTRKYIRRKKINHYYYLHSESKDLIYKRFEPERDSPFVKAVWPVDITDRIDAWKVILEGLALGAKIDRVKQLCERWKCDLKDFEELIIRVKPTDLMTKGADLYLRKIQNLDVDKYWNKLDQKAKKK